MNLAGKQPKNSTFLGSIMKITLKDNVVAEVTKGTTVLSLAKNISPSLAKNALCGRVNGVLVDLDQTINKNCKLELITKSSAEAKSLLNHTASHILAQAVKSVYPSCKIVSGDGDQDGFYYDFDFKTDIDSDSLSTILDEMYKIINADFGIKKEVVPRYEAIIRMSEIEESYKIESLELEAREDVSLITTGDFVDLCDRAHLKSTSFIKKIILNKFSEVSAFGDFVDESVFTRIEGVAFFSDEEYEDYLNCLENNKHTNHKEIGGASELFLINDQGLVFWLPEGLKLKNALLNLTNELHSANDYQEISSPIIDSESKFNSKTYKDYCKVRNYNIMKVLGNNELIIKSINCPSALTYYRLKQRREDELPLKVFECGVLHREIAEQDLNGLFNLSEFTQDDAHIFVAKSKTATELNKVLDMVESFYSKVGLSYFVELATRPCKFLGERKIWTEAENILKEVLTNRFGEGNFGISKGTGSYFGPKINILVKDAKLKSWTTGTIQLDMQLPKKYNLTYLTNKKTEETPVVIHRTIAGSIERLIALIIENTAGKFPFWLAPTQVKLVYSNKRNIKVAERVVGALKAIKIRAKLEYDKMVAENSLVADKQIPYTVYIDSAMVKNQSVLMVSRQNDLPVVVPIKNFLEGLDELNKTRINNLYTKF